MTPPATQTLALVGHYPYGGLRVSQEELLQKPVVFTAHACVRMLQRGAREEDVVEAIRVG